MTVQPADRNLLFGFLALQNDFIAREDLIAAVSVWLTDKSQSLDEILLERRVLGDDEHQLIAALVRKHLEKHAGDAERSLAALSSVGSLRDELTRMGDADVEASLANVAARRAEDKPGPAETLTVGALSSAGMRFLILRPHARGGLGQVSVARDTELNREVALKEMQSQYADHPDNRSRFVLEAEITGGLEHPGIVPVYGLGQYADGRPFYAMRFVRGDSLKEAVDRFYRDVSGRTTSAASENGDDSCSQSARGISQSAFSSIAFRKLLGRFIDVCNAIEYAHSRGVLHRDLKPGNIMLGRYGETLVVDWGLANAVGRPEESTRVEETTLRPASASGSAPTQMGAAIGTPAYMSPEQAAGRLDQLGPESDVYSLGATLYYVLTGRSPIDGDDLGSILRRVQSGEFPPPRELSPNLPRSLESICLKAMSLRPADRYASPAPLADDVEKWLADEPIAAHSEPVLVRTRRWLRKHPKSVAALAATLLVGLTSLTAISAVVSSKNQDLARANDDLQTANEKLREAIERANENAVLANTNADLANRNAALANDYADRANEYAQQANQNVKLADEARADEAEARRRAEAVSQYLVNAFRKPDPWQDGRDIKVADVLKQAVEQLDHDFPDQPLVKAELLRTIGLTYRGLGLPQDSLDVTKRAWELHRRQLGDEHDETLTSLNNLALAYGDTGQVDAAIPLLEQCLEQRQASLGEDHRQTLLVLGNLATSYMEVDQLDKAVPMLERCLERQRAVLGESHRSTLTTMSNLAVAYREVGELDRSLSMHEQCLERRRAVLGEDNPDTLVSMFHVGVLCDCLGRKNEAVSIFEDCLKHRRALLGENHPDTLTSLWQLSMALFIADRMQEALPLFEQSLERRLALLGERHPDTLDAMDTLGMAYEMTEQPDRAAPLYERCLELTRDVRGPDHSDTLRQMEHLAQVYSVSGRTAEALPLYEECLEGRRAVLGEDHAETLSTLSDLARAYRSTGRLNRALPLYEECWQRRQATLGDDDPETLTSLNYLAVTYRSAGQLDKALELQQRCLEQMRSVLGGDDPWTLISMNNLALALEEAGRLDEATPLFAECLERRRSALGESHSETLDTTGNLARCLLFTNRAAEALPLFERFFAGHRAELGADDPRLAQLLALVCLDLLKHQQHSPAEAYLRECLAIREQKLPDDWVTFNTRSMLGRALAGQKRFADAEPLLLEGYRGMKQRENAFPDAAKVRLTEALTQIVDLYAAWGKPDEAATWKTELHAAGTP